MLRVDSGDNRGHWILTEHLAESTALLSDFMLAALEKLDQSIAKDDETQFESARQEFWIVGLILLKMKHEPFSSKLSTTPRQQPF